MKSLPLMLGRDDVEAADNAAKFFAEKAEDAIRERGVFHAAFSGGQTPAKMFERLRYQEVDWSKIHVFQVDERLAPEGPEQNYFHLKRELLDHVALPIDHIHRVVGADAESAAASYAAVIERQLGQEPVLDFVHLGLGADGHTASLVPGDDVLKCRDNIGVSGLYAGWRRVTMTYPILNRARVRIWLVTGRAKTEMLAHLLKNTGGIPALGVSRHETVVFADDEAASELIELR